MHAMRSTTLSTIVRQNLCVAFGGIGTDLIVRVQQLDTGPPVQQVATRIRICVRHLARRHERHLRARQYRSFTNIQPAEHHAPGAPA